MKYLVTTTLLTLSALIVLSTPAAAQRDYFTPEEIEMVRDAQQIDQRIDILIRVIDRRFEALNGGTSATKASAKDIEKWGELPAGSRKELLLDIKRILQKAIDDIDNLVARPDSAVADPNDKKPKSVGELLAKAVRKLAKAAERYQPILKTELDATDRSDAKAVQGSILDALDMCEQIIAAVAKLPASSTKKKGD